MRARVLWGRRTVKTESFMYVNVCGPHRFVKQRRAESMGDVYGSQSVWAGNANEAPGEPSRYRVGGAIRAA